jgi:Tfp pilus assembly protein PilO
VGPEIYLAFQAASAAIAGIRSCCEMLSEGKAEIKRIKQGIDDAKSIAKDVGGFFGFIKGLFADKEEKQLEKAIEQGKPKKEKYIEHIPTEDEIADEFFGHLTEFMESQTTILEWIEGEKEKLLNVYNPKQNNRKAAANLIRYEARINDMTREFAQILGDAPRRLGSVRLKFEEQYAIVVEAQKKAKERERIRKQQEAWQQEAEYNDRVDLMVALLVTLLLVAELWALWISSFTEAF